MNMIEEYLSRYPATMSAISAGATVMAVIVALYLARRQSRAQLQVSADINRYISSGAQMHSETIDPDEQPRMISVTIRNLGPVIASITYWSFSWGVIGGKQRAIQDPAEPDFRNEPIVLSPGKSASIVLSFNLDGYTATMKNLAETSRFGAWSMRFPNLIVCTEAGDRFRAKLGKSLRSLPYTD